MKTKSLTTALCGTALLMALIGSCKKESVTPHGTEQTQPIAPKSLSLKLSTPSQSLTILAQGELGKAYIDLSANGVKDQGEELTGQEQTIAFATPLSQVKIYGDLTKLTLAGVSIDEISGDALSSINEWDLSKASFSPQGLKRFIAQLDKEDKAGKVFIIDEYALNATLLKDLQTAHWTVKNQAGQVIGAEESLLTIRVQLSGEEAQKSEFALPVDITPAPSAELWLDKNLNGKKDAGETLNPQNTPALVAPVGEDKVVTFALHGGVQILDVYAPSNREEDEEGSEDEETETEYSRSAEAESQMSKLFRVDASRAKELISMSWESNLGLQTLDLSGCAQLTTLSALNNPLESLTLPEDQTKLRNIALSKHKLTSVDLTRATNLQDLTLIHGSLQEIMFPETKTLRNLSVENNKLTKLDLSKLGGLVSVWANNNQLTSLTLEAVTKPNQTLKTLQVNDNQLTHLDVSQYISITKLLCQHNQLTSLKVSFSLPTLDCSYNALEEISVLPGAGKTSFLSQLIASHNPKLKRIEASQCLRLSSVDLRQCPLIETTSLATALPNIAPRQAVVYIDGVDATLSASLQTRGWVVRK